MIINVTLKPQINFASLHIVFFFFNQKFEGLVLLLNQHNVQNTLFFCKKVEILIQNKVYELVNFIGILSTSSRQKNLHNFLHFIIYLSKSCVQ